jgi:prevent-host-death family protein
MPFAARLPTLRPVTEIKRHATRIIAQLGQDRAPVVITERGRSTAVLLDIESYDSLLHRLSILEGIARGERTHAEGRVVSHAEVRRRLARWLGAQR